MAATVAAAVAQAATSSTEMPSSAKAQALAQETKKLSFLDLPAELRNQIYHNALESSGTQLLRLNDFPLHKGKACTARDCHYARYPPRQGWAHVCISCLRRLKARLQAQTAEPALLQAHPTIRAEVMAVWLYYARWFVDSAYFVDVGSKATTGLVARWLERMGGQRRALVKGVWVHAFDEGEAGGLAKRFVGGSAAAESKVELEKCEKMNEEMRLSGEAFRVDFKAG